MNNNEYDFIINNPVSATLRDRQKNADNEAKFRTQQSGNFSARYSQNFHSQNFHAQPSQNFNSRAQQDSNANQPSEYISDEQTQILQNYENANLKEVNLSLNKLLMTYLVVMFAFLLTVPAIFIRNEIYYISRDIAELRTKHEVLLEENRALKNNIEFLRYKKEILDAVNVENAVK